jgi:hypothetical protein
MLTARRLMAALSVALLGGCGAADDADTRPAPPPVEETVFRDMVGAMDKARGVEDTLQKQREDRDRQLVESDPPPSP